MNLIVPMAGKSTRFPGLRPKWMLTHPNGHFMAVEAIAGLKPERFDAIYMVFLQEHEDSYHFAKGLRNELGDLGLGSQTRFVFLPDATRDQPETVYQVIAREKIEGPILVKDSDNTFSTEVPADNCICYYDLNLAGLVKPQNKSYLIKDEYGNVVNIVEKQVISPFFCVGGYGFREAKEFARSYENLDLQGARYISHIVFDMLTKGGSFVAQPVSAYVDWGTLEDWENYKRSFATLFIDIDGVLVKNSSSHFIPYYGESEPLRENVGIVRQLRDSGKFQVVITTSRPEKYREVTERQLASLGLRYDYMLMGLYHSKRIVINDYSKSNPYKSCDAINLRRDSDELREILRESLGIDYEEI
jgi:hypothetical protein